MTLSDLGLANGPAASDHRNDRVARGVGVALGKCLNQALETGRLKCGILASASLLQSCPERVLLCVLPVTENNARDHDLHIHHTLITAFCTEHGIRFLKVEGKDLVRAVTRLTHSPADCEDSDSVRHGSSSSSSSDSEACRPDVSCVLIKTPKEGLSFEDKVVLGYYDDMVNSSIFPKPVLSIPG